MAKKNEASWLVVRQSPASKDISMEAEESPLLEAITKKQLKKTQKTLCAL
jgi:hypothetical protein